MNISCDFLFLLKTFRTFARQNKIIMGKTGTTLIISCGFSDNGRNIRIFNEELNNQKCKPEIFVEQLNFQKCKSKYLLRNGIFRGVNRNILRRME